MRRETPKPSCERSSLKLDQVKRQAPRSRVGIQNITQSLDGGRIEALQHFVNDRGNRGKVQAPVKKRLYGDLVGRIEQRRRGSAGPRRRPGQPEAGKAPVIRR